MTTTLSLVYTSGCKFDRRYPACLIDQVTEWYKPDQIALITDDGSLGGDLEKMYGIPVHVYASELPGFWAKLQLWSLPYERIVYIDLDSWIVGDISPLFETGPGCNPDLLNKHSTAVMVIDPKSDEAKQMVEMSQLRRWYYSDQPMLDEVKPDYPYLPGHWARSIKEIQSEWRCLWPEMPPGIGGRAWIPRNPVYDQTKRPMIVNFHGATAPHNTYALPSDAPYWMYDALERWWDCWNSMR